jgi:hypothetical protein
MDRFICNGTDHYFDSRELERLMSAWERSKVPPTKGLILTTAGLGHALQQLLKEALERKHRPKER